jgi:N4-gp56 family major capsid protein
MQTVALTASQFSITVAEQGFAVSVTELLLNASFDDVMASASRLLGRNMAQYLDYSARNTLLLASSVIFGYNQQNLTRDAWSPYDYGTAATATNGLTGTYYFSPPVVKDAVQTLASKNVPRLGETYVCFVHPSQSRRLRDTPEFIEVTKYAAPGNFALGEIGRLWDVVFIETTQVNSALNTAATPANYYQAVFIGDNAFGHAISLPVELRDGGVLDFGREHALAWYAIWGLGLITDWSVVLANTN